VPKFKTKMDSTSVLEIVVTHFQNVLDKTVYENNRHGPIRDFKEFKFVLKFH